MGELWEWENEGLGKFGGFQAINSGRKLVVSFLLLPSVLGGRGYRRMRRNNI